MQLHPVPLHIFSFLAIFSPTLGCFNRQASQVYLKRLSGAHPELAKATNGFDEKYLRRISKLSPMTKMKINFCNGLLGNTSPIVHTLGDAVNCKDVFSRFGKDRKSKTKGHFVSEVSNYIEDDTKYGVKEGSYNQGHDNVYHSEEPWSPKNPNIQTEKPFISQTENFYSEPSEVKQFHGGNEGEFQPIPTQITHDYHKSVPLKETTFSVISSDPQIPGNVDPTPMKQFVGSEIFQKIPTTSENPKSNVWTSSSPDPNPTNWPQTTTVNSYWLTSTQTQKPYEWTTESPSTTTAHWAASTPNNWTPSPQNEYNNWDLNTWTTQKPTVSSKVWTTEGPAIKAKVWTTEKATAKAKIWTTQKPKIEGNLWTTFAPIKHNPTVQTKGWTTFASKKIPTKKAVLPAPSDPTQPLYGNFQVTSNPWPSQFNSDLLNQVGKNVKKVQGQIYDISTPKKKQEQKTEVAHTTDNSYFSIGHEPALEFETHVDLPNFEKEEFSNFGNFETDPEEMFGKYENGRNTKSFITADDNTRPKKEIKNDNQNTYFSIGQATSAFHTGRNDLSYVEPSKSLAEAQINAITEGSEAFKSSLFSREPESDIIELYLPDPLAPGHPMGNGNHGWAPIEEWAKSQRAVFDVTNNNPSWANSEISTEKAVSSQVAGWTTEKQPHWEISQPNEEWKKREISNFEYDKTVPVYKPGKTITTIKKWTNPSPATYIQPETTERHQATEAPKIKSTLDQATETVVKSLLNTNSYPVTPRYHNPFGNFASLDLSHLAGPTGPPGIAMFHTNPAIKTAQQLQLGNIHINSNSHYMKQNPFLANPTTTNAPSVTRNVDQSDFWSYNPVTESSVVKSYNPFSKNIWEPAPIRKEKSISFDSDFKTSTIKPTVPTSSAQITGYSYKNVHFPNTGVNTGYDSYNYKTK
jgi:hypothetical protein